MLQCTVICVPIPTAIRISPCIKHTADPIRLHHILLLIVFSITVIVFTCYCCCCNPVLLLVLQLALVSSVSLSLFPEVCTAHGVVSSALLEASTTRPAASSRYNLRRIAEEPQWR